jgi:hypothetical protein
MARFPSKLNSFSNTALKVSTSLLVHLKYMAYWFGVFALPIHSQSTPIFGNITWLAPFQRFFQCRDTLKFSGCLQYQISQSQQFFHEQQQDNWQKTTSTSGFVFTSIFFTDFSQRLALSTVADSATDDYRPAAPLINYYFVST